MAHSASSVSTSGPHSSASNGSTTGFKVYGSLFKVSSRYQFLNPLGKGSYGIVWYEQNVLSQLNLKANCNVVDFEALQKTVKRGNASLSRKSPRWQSAQ
jgi:hypothetical protein